MNAATQRHPFRTPLLVFVGLGAVLWGGKYLIRYFRFESTDDAFLAGHVHQISPEIAGQVREVLVHENETVTAGQPLLRIDPQEFDLGVRKAEAALQQASGTATQVKAGTEQSAAKVAQAQARAAQAIAQLAQARAQYALAHANLSRSNQLASGEDRAVTPADLDASRAADQAAHAGMGAAEAAVTAAQADIKAAAAEANATSGQVQAAEAAVELARAAVADARRQQGYVAVRAPAGGRIGNKNVEPGNRVQPGQTLMVLVERQVWIEANFKETQLANVKTGQRVEISIDSIPGQNFEGKVVSFAPATGAQFALLPADNATGNFTKVVQRVPVRIEFEGDSIRGFEERLRPGLSATVDVDLHR